MSQADDKLNVDKAATIVIDGKIWYSCDQCNRSFSQTTHLDRHKNVMPCNLQKQQIPQTALSAGLDPDSNTIVSMQFECVSIAKWDIFQSKIAFFTFHLNFIGRL